MRTKDDPSQQSKINQLAERFRTNLRQRRLDQQLTQERLAERAGIDPRYYQKIEQGGSVPTITYAYLLAEALDTSLDELFVSKKK